MILYIDSKDSSSDMREFVERLDIIDKSIDAVKMYQDLIDKINILSQSTKTTVIELNRTDVLKISDNQQVTTWEEISQLVENIESDPGILNAVKNVHASNPDQVNRIIRISSNERRIAQIAITQLSVLGNATDEELGKNKTLVEQFIKETPEAFDQVYPLVGTNVVHSELNPIAEHAIVVQEGIIAEINLASMNRIREICKQVVPKRKSDVDCIIAYMDKQDDVKRVQLDMAKKVRVYAKNIFSKIDNPPLLLALLELFIGLCQDAQDAPDASGIIRDIVYFIRHIVKESDGLAQLENNYCNLKKEFMKSLSSYDKYSARKLYLMEGQITSTITKFESIKMVTGCGKQSACKRVQSFNKYLLPTESSLDRLFSSNNKDTLNNEFIVQSNLLPKDKLYGKFNFKEIDNDKIDDDDCDYKLTKIVVFKPKANYQVTSNLESGNNPKIESYVLIDVASIYMDSTKNVVCKDLDANIWPINVSYVSLHQKALTKVNKRLQSGYTRTPVHELTSMVSSRYKGQTKPLVGIIEGNSIKHIMTGAPFEEKKYRTILNKLLRYSGVQLLSTSEIPTVFQISSMRKDLKKYDNPRNSSAVLPDIIKKEHEGLLIEIQREDFYYDDEEVQIKEKRINWLERMIKNPPSQEEEIARQEILNTLNSKVNLVEVNLLKVDVQDENIRKKEERKKKLELKQIELDKFEVNTANENRMQIDQILRDGFDMWTDPNDEVEVSLTHNDVKKIITRVKDGLLFAFNKNFGLFQKMEDTINNYFKKTVEDTHDDLIMNDIPNYNNFTLIEEKVNPSPKNKNKNKSERKSRG